jgi:hypothetical protein
MWSIKTGDLLKEVPLYEIFYDRTRKIWPFNTGDLMGRFDYNVRSEKACVALVTCYTCYNRISKGRFYISFILYILMLIPFSKSLTKKFRCKLGSVINQLLVNQDYIFFFFIWPNLSFKHKYCQKHLYSTAIHFLLIFQMMLFTQKLILFIIKLLN